MLGVFFEALNEENSENAVHIYLLSFVFGVLSPFYCFFIVFHFRRANINKILLTLQG